jgi:hypothetical protein
MPLISRGQIIVGMVAINLTATYVRPMMHSLERNPELFLNQLLAES